MGCNRGTVAFSQMMPAYLWIFIFTYIQKLCVPDPRFFAGTSPIIIIKKCARTKTIRLWFYETTEWKMRFRAVFLPCSRAFRESNSDFIGFFFWISVAAKKTELCQCRKKGREGTAKKNMKQLRIQMANIGYAARIKPKDFKLSRRWLYFGC